MRSEIGAVYGPLLVAYAGISVATASTAGDEEAGILGLIFAYPLQRRRWVLANAVAVMISVAVVGLGMFVGLVAGVAVGGGGIAVTNSAALAIHLAFFGWAAGALALALAVSTGRRALASAGAASFVVLGFFVNGFAPLVGAIDWLKYLSLFYYYEGHDPITNGVDAGELVVLALATIMLTVLAVLGVRRRDICG
jgi:ABC-2 type transport system permease protein